MPVFGNRMIVETANYKHVEKFKKDVADREDKLGRWMKEKTERKKNLEKLHERIRQNSIYSNDSRLGDEATSRRGSIVSESKRDSAVNVLSDGSIPTNERRSSSLTVTSSPSRVSVPDTQHIVGGGRKSDSICGRCSIQ